LNIVIPGFSRQYFPKVFFLCVIGSSFVSYNHSSVSVPWTITYHKKGETIILTNQDKNLNSAVKKRLIKTFFTVYPEEKKYFNTNATDTVHVRIDTSYSGVAYTSGGRTVISAAWFHKHPQDTDVITHEVMHIVQAYPSHSGPDWLTEGIADYARYKYGVNNKAAGWKLTPYSSKQSYTDSYRITARFLVWLTQNYDKNIVKKLDTQMRNKTYTKELWKDITGKSLDNLWKAYSDNPQIDRTVNWTSASDSSVNGLIHNYWNVQQHYFNTNNQGNGRFQYWPQAHALDVLVRAFLRTKNKRYAKCIRQWYDGVKAQTGGEFINAFNDDMEWNELAMLRAYKAIGDQKFKATAINVWNEIKTGWTNVGGGGIMWQVNTPDFKNTPANMPACIFAAKLYQIDHKKSDLDWAKKIYKWEVNNLVNQSTGAVWDGFDYKDGSKKIHKNLYTYNQGTFIGASLRLYEITGKKSYLDHAVQTANFTLNSMVDTVNGVLKGGGTGDGGLFNGIFIRYFKQLIMSPDLTGKTRQRYVNFLQHNALVLWAKGTNKNLYIFGSYWGKKPGNKVDLTVDLSGVILMESAAELSKKGYFKSK
jgi:predicted alpha-1,6-mannanase (GH76 family)